MLIEENVEKHEGKTLSHFEDLAGNKLESLYMIDGLVIVFRDGTKIKISQDWRGQECYLSQYEC